MHRALKARGPRPGPGGLGLRSCGCSISCFRHPLLRRCRDLPADSVPWRPTTICFASTLHAPARIDRAATVRRQSACVRACNLRRLTYLADARPMSGVRRRASSSWRAPSRPMDSPALVDCRVGGDSLPPWPVRPFVAPHYIYSASAGSACADPLTPLLARVNCLAWRACTCMHACRNWVLCPDHATMLHDGEAEDRWGLLRATLPLGAGSVAAVAA